jgi:hypothetical protein
VEPHSHTKEATQGLDEGEESSQGSITSCGPQGIAHCMMMLPKGMQGRCVMGSTWPWGAGADCTGHRPVPVLRHYGWRPLAGSRVRPHRLDW